MNLIDPPPLIDLDLDRLIASFEEAMASGPVDVARFLPAKEHPHFHRLAIELLRVDMELAWERGEPRFVADYEQRFPDVFTNPTATSELAFEEQRQQQRHSVALPATHTTAVVPSWTGEDYPRVGSLLPPGFTLVAELGRGAFGRVYLAEEMGLAKRPVALKVSSKLLHEAQTLARLQHTNIVPIYAVHHVGRFQLVVMPYLGAATLADVLQVLRAADTRPLRAETLVSAITAKSVQPPSDSMATPVPAKPVLHTPPWAEASYTEAILTLASELADGLQHAHDRGILHRDLKPANILLTDDGHPMLLDFNLADDQQISDLGPQGGTPRYMAPEQLAAMLSDQPCRDPRADLYALGLILHELLIGPLPFGDHRGPWRTVVTNTLVEREHAWPITHESPAITAILRRCLAPKPADRYASAQQLADDCREHLASRPLRHAREPFSRERARKWLKRHPRFTSGTSVALVAGIVLLALASVTIMVREQSRRLRANEAFTQAQQTRAFVQPLAVAPDAPLGQYRQARERIGLALEPYGGRGAIHRQARVFRDIPGHQQPNLADALAELLYADAQAAWALAQGVDDRREALALNDQALRLNSTLQRPLLAQRIRLLEANNEPTDEVRWQWRMLPEESTSTTFIHAIEALTTKRYADAQERLETLAHQGEKSYSLWMALGLAHLHQQAFEAAADAFLAASTLEPQSSWAWLHRGLALLEAKQWSRAKAGFVRFNSLEPQEPIGRVNLALACWHLGEYREALTVLEQAEAMGYQGPRLYSLRSQCYQSLRQPKEAANAYQAGLRATPTDADGWTIQGEMLLTQQPPNAQAALRAFEQALALRDDHAPALRGQASVLAEHLQRPREAIAVLKRLLDRFPNALEDRAGYAVLLARTMHTAEAQREARLVAAKATQALTLYQAGSALALAARTADERREVVTVLRGVLRMEAQWASTMAHDHDLASVQREAAFQELLAAARVFISPPKP